jgi:antitoxin component of RelBE/YafQ-DinJ toxin-antitoxin module
MNKDEMICVRVPKETKEAAVRALGGNGYSLSNAINVFLCQVAKQGKMPEFRAPTENGVLSINAIKDVVVAVASRFPSISQVALRGSYSHGTATFKSDVDLLVVGSVPLSDLISFQNTVSSLLHKPVDAFPPSEGHPVRADEASLILYSRL